MAKRKRRRKAPLKPRMGPAANIRPAGAHKSKKEYDRAENKAVIDAEAADQE